MFRLSDRRMTILTIDLICSWNVFCENNELVEQACNLDQHQFASSIRMQNMHLKVKKTTTEQKTKN